MRLVKLIERFNEEPIPKKDVEKELNEAYEKDTKFENSRVLYSMCNSPPEIARSAHLKFIEANLGDALLYPGTQLLEKSVINMICDLLNAPDTAGGHILNGGSEANILSLWIARNKWITKNKIRPSRQLEVIVPDSAHYSFEVACDMLQLKILRIPLDEQFRMDVSIAEENITDYTCAIVGIAGTTELGVIDPIDELSKVCLHSEIHLHVDAAFGGFVFPFLVMAGWRKDIPLFDFRLRGVRSITIDPHKMGRSTQPAGALILRDKNDFRFINFSSYYLSSTVQHTMLGTRCSASVAAAYAVMRTFGKTGYIKMVQKCMENTYYLCRLLKSEGFELAIEKPIAPIVVVKFPREVLGPIKKNLYTRKKWRVSESRHPPGIRVVLMPHVRRDYLPTFVSDLKTICRNMGII